MRSFERYLDSFLWLRTIRIEFPHPVRMPEYKWENLLDLAVEKGNRLFEATGRLETVRYAPLLDYRWNAMYEANSPIDQRQRTQEDWKDGRIHMWKTELGSGTQAKAVY